MKGICTRIKQLRKEELEMTQIEFAKGLGVTNAHISKIEKGGTVPSEALIKLISKEYHINENWLKTGTGPVCIDEVEEKIDERMETASSIFNKIMRNSSYRVREIASELEVCYANITDVTCLDEEQKIEYLTLVKNMFLIINQYNSIIKDHTSSKQMIIEDVRDTCFEDYKKDLENCLDEYKKLLV